MLLRILEYFIAKLRYNFFFRFTCEHRHIFKIYAHLLGKGKNKSVLRVVAVVYNNIGIDRNFTENICLADKVTVLVKLFKRFYKVVAVVVSEKHFIFRIADKSVIFGKIIVLLI